MIYLSLLIPLSFLLGLTAGKRKTFKRIKVIKDEDLKELMNYNGEPTGNCHHIKNKKEKKHHGRKNRNHTR